MEDFRERRREVRRYLVMLKIIEKRASEVDLKKYALEAKIFRGGAILVIYNAVEASARSAIQAIYDEIRTTATPFEHLQTSLRKRVIADFQRHSSRDRDCNMRNVAVDIVLSSFNSERLFSGNVDAREIKSQASDYGFSIPTNRYQQTRNGAELVKVKNKRNDLAHGVKSFSEVGSEYTLREIMDLGRFCMAYMESVLSGIEDYLDTAGYMVS